MKHSGVEARLNQLETLAADLDRSREELRAILEAEPECVKTVSRDCRLLEMNPAGLRMIEADDIESVRGASLIDIVVPEHRDRFEELNRRVFAGETVIEEFEIVGLQGTRRHMETHAVPLRDADGVVRAHLAITRDVTQKKLAAVEHQEMQAQLQHAQKLESLGVLTGGIAHDFNNILVAILGGADLALETLEAEHPARCFVASCVSAAERAAELCNQMLVYAGKGALQSQTVDLSALVAESLKLLEVSVTKRARLVARLDSSVAMIEADPTQLRQVVLNLVINAAEASIPEAGSVEVSTGQVECLTEYLGTVDYGRDLPPGSYVFLDVRDHGHGMSPETLKRIFDPYFSTKSFGRGLGLASVLGIIRSHRAALEITSRVGQGTRFRVLIPASATAQETAVEPEARETGFQTRWRVLLVDDEVVVQRTASPMLELAGLEVLCADSGEQALAILCGQETNVDLVILDHTMPGLDGRQTLHEIRGRGLQMPVILSSGHVRAHFESDLELEGFAGFVHKPYRTSVLRAEVQRVMEEPARERP